jgi:hypothetical protein
MSVNFTHSYVKELENLILEELLPVYERWHREHDLSPSYKNAPKDLVDQIKRKKTVPALFKPLKSQS